MRRNMFERERKLNNEYYRLPELISRVAGFVLEIVETGKEMRQNLKDTSAENFDFSNPKGFEHLQLPEDSSDERRLPAVK